MTTLFDRVFVGVRAAGDGLIPGAGMRNYRDFSAVTVGAEVPYVIEDVSAWETGRGVWNGETLSREVEASSEDGAPIALGARARLMVTPLAADLALARDLAPVATSGAYADLDGRPALGDAAARDAADIVAPVNPAADLQALAEPADQIEFLLANPGLGAGHPNQKISLRGLFRNVGRQAAQWTALTAWPKVVDPADHFPAHHWLSLPSGGGDQWIDVSGVDFRKVYVVSCHSFGRGLLDPGPAGVWVGYGTAGQPLVLGQYQTVLFMRLATGAFYVVGGANPQIVAPESGSSGTWSWVKKANGKYDLSGRGSVSASASTTITLPSFFAATQLFPTATGGGRIGLGPSIVNGTSPHATGAVLQVYDVQAGGAASFKVQNNASGTVFFTLLITDVTP